MSPFRHAAFALLTLSVVLYFRDASLIKTAQVASIAQRAEQATSSSSPTFDFESPPKQSGSTVHLQNDDDDDFGTDTFKQPSSSAKTGSIPSADDEFNFAGDYDYDLEEGAGQEMEFDSVGGNGAHRVLIRFDDSQFSSQFQSVRAALERHYPDLRGGNIRGEKYPVSTLVNVVSIAVPLLVTLLMAASGLLVKVGVPQEWIDKLQNNRMMVLPAVMVFNIFVRPKMTSTGAFEVMYNGALVFSKLESGVLPVDGDLRLLVNALTEAGLHYQSEF